MAARGRTWGFWTRGKLDILRRYLQGFMLASYKKSAEAIYLDLFAGEPENRDRDTGQPIDGSAAIALRTAPQFTRLRFFELEPKAKQLEAYLRNQFPTRDIKVHRGDCNQKIVAALAELESVRWAPAFAFVDPNGPDFRWTTLKALADHKRGFKYKVELWILFPVGLFMRNLPRKKLIAPESADKLTKMFGTAEWADVYNDRVAGILDGETAADEYLNLMRWRLENILGYRRTHPLEIKNEQGAHLYDMVFATDNEAGDRIMTNLYGHALEDFPAMQKEAIARHKIALPPLDIEELELFDTSRYGRKPEPPPAPVKYRYEPPTPPYRSKQ
jgi:three-Cys-motif partner protein